MTNLEILIAAKKEMDWSEIDAFGAYEAFDQYFIGALSILVSKEDWESALKTAKNCLENYKRPVSRG